jgi:hypothetical protein
MDQQECYTLYYYFMCDNDGRVVMASTSAIDIAPAHILSRCTWRTDQK